MISDLDPLAAGGLCPADLLAGQGDPSETPGDHAKQIDLAETISSFGFPKQTLLSTVPADLFWGAVVQSPGACAVVPPVAVAPFLGSGPSD